jgi:hypothetical protein
MQAEEEPLNLFFGLTKHDLTNITEVFVLSLISFIIFAAVVTFIAFILSRIFEKKDDSLGILSFVVAGFSFIPFMGIFYGLSGITWGLLTNKNNGKILAIVSSIGVVFNILLIAIPTIFFMSF